MKRRHTTIPLLIGEGVYDESPMNYRTPYQSSVIHSKFQLVSVCLFDLVFSPRGQVAQLVSVKRRHTTIPLLIGEGVYDESPMNYITSLQSNVIHSDSR